MCDRTCGVTLGEEQLRKKRWVNDETNNVHFPLSVHNRNRREAIETGEMLGDMIVYKADAPGPIRFILGSDVIETPPPQEEAPPSGSEVVTQRGSIVDNNQGRGAQDAEVQAAGRYSKRLLHIYCQTIQEAQSTPQNNIFFKN